MKRISFIIGIICGVGMGSLSAQNINTLAGASISGVYKNSDDYSKGNLSLSFECKSSGKIKLHHLFAGRYADVIVGGKKTRFNKDSIFGYHTCKNEDYRFYKAYDEEFRILENKGIIIYLSYVRSPDYNAKFIRLLPKYYFSKTIDSEILPLTIKNLKRTFPYNLKFHRLLDVEFGEEESLSEYSANDKMYKVNLLFKKSNLK